MQNLMLQLHDRLLEADKEGCVPTVTRMIELAGLARSGGILELEAEIEEESNVFLRTGVELVVDGRDPEIVEHVMLNLMLAGNYSGTELLKRMIIATGVLKIQQGENPSMTALTLASMLGEEYLAAANETSCQYRVKRINRISMLYKRTALPESAEFEERLFKFYTPSIYHIVRSVEHDVLVTALCGCGGRLLGHIMGSVSQSKFAQICKDIECEYMNNLCTEDILYAQEYILRKVDELEDMHVIFAMDIPMI
ncbi:MAG: hypothetical protein FWE20_02540 [Defluviitaleaceae bacterium]|nr:hypothetical protein [Defluviitaleaceae bacterium]